MKKIMLVIILCAALMQAGFAMESGSPSRQQGAGIAAVSLNDVRAFDARGVQAKTPLATDKLVYTTYFLKPWQVLAFHGHPASDELFFVVEGRGQFVVGKNSILAGSGTAVYGPAGVSHGIVNYGREDMVVISVQSPRPVQETVVANASMVCAVCKQELIIPEGAKEGDVFVCPRCQAKLKLIKTKDGKWLTKHI